MTNAGIGAFVDLWEFRGRRSKVCLGAGVREGSPAAVISTLSPKHEYLGVRKLSQAAGTREQKYDGSRLRRVFNPSSRRTRRSCRS